jgi:anti-sigma factor RsiW
MAHLGERVTDYVFGEMSPAEASAVQAHLRECSECVRQVEELQRTRTLLQAIPDAEPPRPMIFEVERRRASSRFRPWLAPAASALAASILTAVFLSAAASGPSRPADVQAWLAAELEKRDKAHEMDLQRVRSEIAYWERQQRAVSRETMDTARTLQLLARNKVPTGD